MKFEIIYSNSKVLFLELNVSRRWNSEGKQLLCDSSLSKQKWKICKKKLRNSIGFSERLLNFTSSPLALGNKLSQQSGFLRP